ncbi:MAG: ABC transporter permease, partial [Pirellulaceae bacterium]|nr:ABC transporter permease [Pirellulaceae bacterium]
MKWSNIKLIYRRELRDQLRDRRTLFTIAILPLLLYPFMGMTFLQVASFLKDHTAKVLIIGHEEAQLNGSEISLFSEEEFNPRFLGSLSSQKLQLAFEKKPTKPEFNITKDAKERIKAEEFDAIIYFPDSFSDNLKKMLAEKREPQNNNTFNEEIAEDPLEPLIYYNTTKDKSSVAYQRINLILGNWKNAITIENLDSYNVPETAINPFTLQSKDTADEALKQEATCSKILPFIALIWALTGAFY